MISTLFILNLVFLSSLGQGTSFSEAPNFNKEFEIKTMGLTIENPEQVLLLGGAEVDPVVQLRYDGDLRAGMTLRASLTGPGNFVEQTFSVPAADMAITLPRALFTEEGPYVLRDVQLHYEGETLTLAKPSEATIQVLEELIVGRVEVNELSRDDLQALGYAFNEDDFRSINFNLSLIVGSKEVDVDVPVLLPRNEHSSFEPKVIVDPIQPYFRSFVVREPLGGGSGGGNGSSETTPIATERYLMSLLVIPGKFHYMKNHFNLSAIVLNAAPDGFDVRVTDLKSEIRLPDATRYGVPVQLAPGGDQQLRRDMVNLGEDGVAATEDDRADIAGGEEAVAEYLLTGEISGMYEVAVDITGEVALPQGTETVRTSSVGTVYVRSPEFSVTFEHPDAVAEGEPYDLFMHITNVGTVPLQSFSVSLDPFRLTGVEIENGWNPNQTLPDLAPGAQGTLHYRMRSLVNGKVIASYYRVEGGVDRALQLSVGVSPRGERISPYVLNFPAEFDQIDAALREPLKRYAKALMDLAQMADDELPVGLAPLPGAIPRAYNEGLVRAVQGAAFGNDLDQIHAQLWARTMRSQNDLPEMDRFRRHAVRLGEPDLDAVFATVLSQIADGRSATSLLEFLLRETEGTPGLFLGLIESDQPLDVTIRDGRGAVMDSQGTRDIPFGGLFPLGSNRHLVWLSNLEATPRLSLTPQSPDTPANVRVLATLTNVHTATTATDTDDEFLADTEALDPHVTRFWDSGTRSMTTLMEVGFDLDRNLMQHVSDGSDASTTASAFAETPFALAGVQQLTPRHNMAADVYGRDLVFRFTKPLDLTALGDLGDHLEINGEPVAAAVLQDDGRILTVAARMPLGPYRTIHYNLRNLTAVDGTLLETASGTLEGSTFFSGVTVAGRVADRNGTDLTQAQVFLWQDLVDANDQGTSYDHRNAVILHTVAPNADGRFSFDFVPFYPFSAVWDDYQVPPDNPAWDRLSEAIQSLRSFKIGILLPDGRYREETFHPQAVGQEVETEFAFLQQGEIYGRVQHEDGRPVAYTPVVLNPQTSIYGTQVTETDADGRYRFTGVEVGQVLIKTQSEDGHIGMRGVFLTQNTSPLEVNIAFTEGAGTISGRVTTLIDGVETPVVDAWVGWAVYGTNPLEFRAQPNWVSGFPYTHLTRTDGDGNFLFANAPVGTGTLWSYRRDLGLLQATASLVADQSVAQNLVYIDHVAKTGSISGQVVDLNGFAVAHIKVACQGRWTVASADGRFTLRDIPHLPSTYVAAHRKDPVTGDIALYGGLRVSLTEETPDIASLEIVVRPPSRVSGRYLDVANQPIPFAPIYNPSTGELKGRPFSYTDGAGNWSGVLFSGAESPTPIDNAGVGPHDFTGLRPPVIAHTHTWVPLAGREDVIVREEPQSELVVRLVDASGFPVIGRVTVTGSLPDTSQNGPGMPIEDAVIYSVITDGEGRIHLDRLNTRETTVWGSNTLLGETEKYTYIPTALAPGEEPREIVLAFAGEAEPSNLFGRIFDVDTTTPAPQGTIVEAYVSGVRARTTVDEEGWYRFETLVDSQTKKIVDLRVYHPDTQHLAMAKIQLDRDLRFRHDLILNRRGTVQVRVVDHDGTPVDYAGIELVYPDLITNNTDDPLTQRRVARTLQLTPSQPMASFDLVPVGTITLAANAGNGLIAAETFGLPADGEPVEITLRLERAVTVGGRFIDHAGDLIAEAEVALQRERDVLLQKLTGALGAADEGRFLFEGLPMRPYTLRGTDPATSLEGHLEVTPTLYRPNPDVTLQIDPVTHLDGLVLYDGQPLANATVELRQRGRSLFTGSDSAGRYSFTNLALGTYELHSYHSSVSARARVKVRLDRAHETTTQNLEYATMVDLDLQLQLADGRPPARLQVMLRQGDLIVGHAFTDVDGQVSFKNLPRTHLNVRAKDEVHHHELDTDIVLTDADGGHTERTVTFAGTGVVHGFVRDETGAPLSLPVRVGLMWYGGGENMKMVWVDSLADGSFRYNRAPLGKSIRVIATEPVSLQAASKTVQLESHGEEVQADLTFRATTFAGGTVTYADGTPVPYAKVWVERPAYIDTQADALGRFQLAPIVTGEVSLFAKDPFSPRQAATLLVTNAAEGEDPQPHHDLELQLGGVADITGDVTLSDGTPVTHGHVTLTMAGSEARKTTSLFGDGSYYFQYIPVGEVTLTAYDADRGTTSTLPVTIDAATDGQTYTADLGFQPSFFLGGTVRVNGSQTPVANALVELWRQRATGSGYDRVYSTTTSDLGVFGLDHVYPGVYRLVAQDENLDYVLKESLTVQAADREDLDLYLNPTAYLVGTVLDTRDRIMPGGSVQLLTTTGRLVGSDIISATGQFRFDDVPTGNFVLQVRDAFIAVEQNVTLVSGANAVTVRTQATVDLTGDLIYQSDTARLTTWRIVSGELWRGGRVGADGSFSIPRLPVGSTYQLEISAGTSHRTWDLGAPTDDLNLGTLYLDGTAPTIDAPAGGYTLDSLPFTVTIPIDETDQDSTIDPALTYLMTGGLSLAAHTTLEADGLRFHLDQVPTGLSQGENILRVFAGNSSAAKAYREVPLHIQLDGPTLHLSLDVGTDSGPFQIQLNDQAPIDAVDDQVYLHEVPTGTHELRLRTATRGRYTSVQVDGHPLTQTHFLFLHPMGGYQGIVTHPNGSPAIGAIVRADGVPTTTDQDGRYVLDLLTLNRAHAITVEAPGRFGYLDAPSLQQAGAISTGHDIQLQGLAQVSGQVLDTNEVDVIANATVTLSYPDLPEHFWQTTQADASGNYSFTDVIARTLRLTATDPVSGRVGIETIEDLQPELSRTQDLILEPAGAISGVVRDAQSDPVTGFALRVLDSDQVLAEVTTETDGSFAIANLPYGDYTLDGESQALLVYVQQAFTLDRETLDLGDLSFQVDQIPVVDSVSVPTAINPTLTQLMTIHASDDRHLAEIRLTYDGNPGHVDRKVVSGTSGSFSTSFDLPDDLPEGNMAYRVEVEDHFGQIGVHTGTVQIVHDLTGPTITLYEPTQNSAVTEGDPLTVVFKMADPLGVAESYLTYGSERLPLTAQDYDPNTDRTTVQTRVPGVDADGPITLDIVGVDGLGNESRLALQLDVANRNAVDGPDVTFVSPLPDQPLPFHLETGFTLDLDIRLHDADGLSDYRVTVANEELGTGSLFENDFTFTASYVIPESLRAATSFEVTVTTRDLGGNETVRTITVNRIDGTRFDGANPLVRTRLDARDLPNTVILDGGEHILDGAFSLDNLVLVQGAVLTQTTSDRTDIHQVAGSHLNVAQHLVVDSRSRIDVSTKGFQNAMLYSPDIAEAGHGGANGGDPWLNPGSIVEPTTVGSWQGGGAIHLEAGTLWLQGGVHANGVNTGSLYNGSGGSLWLQAGAIHGFARVTANAYPEGESAGSQLDGSGGRIAIWGDPADLRVEAFGARDGGAGTVFVRRPDATKVDGFDDRLIVADHPDNSGQNQTPLVGIRGVLDTDMTLTRDVPFGPDTVDRLSLPRLTGFDRFTGMFVWAEGTPEVRGRVARSEGDLVYSDPNVSFPNFQPGDTLVIGFPYDAVEVRDGATLLQQDTAIPTGLGFHDARWELPDGLNLFLRGDETFTGVCTLRGQWSADHFQLDADQILYLDGNITANQLTIPADATLALEDRRDEGAIALSAPIMDIAGTLTAVQRLNGTRHHGGRESRAAALDVVSGSFYRAESFAGAHGGRVTLDFTNLDLTGTIDVSGQGNAGGGSAGGAIRLTGTSLTGSGSLKAHGYRYSGHGAGGGRIAIHVDDLTGWTGAATSFGWHQSSTNSGNKPGGAGTVFYRTSAWPLGRLVVDNGGMQSEADGTVLPSFGTRQAASTGDGTSIGGSFPAYNDFAGLWVAVDGQDPARVASHTSVQLLPETSFPAVTSGQSYEGIYQFDVLEVRNGATLYATDRIVIHGELIRDGGTINAVVEEPGGSDAVVLTDGATELVVDDGTRAYELDNFHLTVDFAMDVDRITLRNGASLTYKQAIRVATLEADNATVLAQVAGEGFALTADDVTLANGSLWTVADAYNNGVSTVSYPLRASISATLSVDASSTITVSDKLKNTDYPVWHNKRYTGEAHGGYSRMNLTENGHRVDHEATGSFMFPAWPGNSGAIRLQVGTLNLDGDIRADSGRRAGGSVWLEVQQGSGAGTISAKDNAATSAGGGGRIAVHYGNDRTFVDAWTFELAPTKYNSNELNNKGAGTLYLKGSAQQHGELIVRQDPTHLESDHDLLMRSRYSGITGRREITLNVGDRDSDPQVIDDAGWTDLPPGMAGIWARFRVADTDYEAQVLDNGPNWIRLGPPIAGTLPSLIPAGTTLTFAFKIDKLTLSHGASLFFDGPMEVGTLDIGTDGHTSGVWATDLIGLGPELRLEGNRKLRLILEEPGDAWLTRDIHLTDSSLVLDRPLEVRDVTLVNAAVQHSPIWDQNLRFGMPWLHLTARHVTADAGSRFEGIEGDAFYQNTSTRHRVHGGLYSSSQTGTYGSLMYPDMPGSGYYAGGRIFLKAESLAGGTFQVHGREAGSGSIWLDVETVTGSLFLDAGLGTGRAAGGRIALHYRDKSGATITTDTEGTVSSGTYFRRDKDQALGTLVIDNGPTSGQADDLTPLPSFDPVATTGSTTQAYDSVADQTTLWLDGATIEPWFVGFELAVNGATDTTWPIQAMTQRDGGTEFVLAGNLPSLAVGAQISPVLRLQAFNLCTDCRVGPDTLPIIVTGGGLTAEQKRASEAEDRDTDPEETETDDPADPIEDQPSEDLEPGEPIEIRGETLQLDHFETDRDLWLIGTRLEIRGTLRAKSIHLRDGAVLTHPVLPEGVEGGLRMVATERIEIDASSLIDLDGKGWHDAEADLNPAHGTFARDLGEHNDQIGTCYDSPLWPYLPGRGQAGGGRIRIESPEIEINGVVQARGVGFSSGGSVLLRAHTLTGRGKIDVAGGSDNDRFGGAGRLALHVNQLFRFSGQLTADVHEPIRRAIVLADLRAGRFRYVAAYPETAPLTLPPQLPESLELAPEQIGQIMSAPSGFAVDIGPVNADLRVYRGLWLQNGVEAARVRDVTRMPQGHWLILLEKKLELDVMGWRLIPVGQIPDE
ncbi:Carboxypeptidase regulatory-like domain-containing protein [Sulfidibacter corallicola]